MKVNNCLPEAEGTHWCHINFYMISTKQFLPLFTGWTIHPRWLVRFLNHQQYQMDHFTNQRCSSLSIPYMFFLGFGRLQIGFGEPHFRVGLPITMPKNGRSTPDDWSFSQERWFCTWVFESWIFVEVSFHFCINLRLEKNWPTCACFLLVKSRNEIYHMASFPRCSMSMV